MNFFGNGATFTNNGTLTNTAGANTFYFYGNGFGTIVQSFAGAGTYSGNARLDVFNVVTVNVAPSTSMTYPVATNQTVFTVENGSTLNLNNALNVIAPSSGAPYVGLSLGGTESGAGGLKTHGNVTTVSSSNGFTAPFEAVSGVQNGNGSYNGPFTVDAGASFQLGSTLSLYGNLTIPSGATVDINGSSVNFFGNGATFTNNGTLTNSSATLNIFYFYGNGVVNGITQTFAGAGNYGNNLRVQVFNVVTVNTTAGTALNGLMNLQIDPVATLNLPNQLTFAGPSSGMVFALINNGGTIAGAGGLKTQGLVQIISGGTLNTTLEVNTGTTLSQGNFNNAVTIDNTGTFKLNSTTNFYDNLTINGGGTLDLFGSAAQFIGNAKAFTNNGTLTNSGGSNLFYLYGNGVPGSIVQTLSGAGAYGSSVQVRIFNDVTVNVAAATSMTFNSAANATNIQIDPGSILDTTNVLNITAPSSGGSYVGFSQGGVVQGVGGLKTHGLITTVSAGATNSPFEVVSGAQNGNGTFNGLFTVDTGASFQLLSTLSLSGDLTIQNGATLDFFGSALYFVGNGKTLTNNGSVINTGAFNILYFYGNGVPGSVVQHLATSMGTWANNIREEVFNDATLILDGDAQLGVVQVDNACTLDITNRTLRLSGPGIAMNIGGVIITPGSTIEMNGTAAQSVQTSLNGALFNNLTINNATGVNIPNPGANPMTVPGTLKLSNGVFTVNNNLTMGNGATIARSLGSLSGSPTFGATINILYFGTNAIASGFEIPTNNQIATLTDNNTNTVSITNSLIVNGNATVAVGATLTGPGANTLYLNGAITTNNGTISHPSIIFDTGTHSIAGSGAWTGLSLQTLTASNTSLANNVTFSVGTFGVNGGTSFSTGVNTLTFNGGAFNNAGTVSGSVKTTGSAVTLDAGASGFNAALDVNSGTTTGKGLVNSTLVVDATATALQIGSGNTLTVAGNVTTNAPLSGLGTFRSNGTTFTNNAAVSVAQLQFGGTAQSLTGTGNFIGNTATILNGSTTTLAVNKQVSTVVVNSGGGLNISSFTLFLSGAGTALTNSGTFTDASGTVEYNGSGSAQTLSNTVPSYNNLSLNNTFGTTGFSGLTVTNLIQVKAGTFTSSSTFKDVQIDIGATLAGVNATTMNVSGLWTNNGTFTANGNTVNINGASAQSLAGSSPTIFGGFAVNNASGITLNFATTVSGILTLTNGKLTTGVNVLSMPCGSSVAGGSASSYVIGNMLKNYCGTGSFTYPLGTVNGFSPFTSNVTTLTTNPSVLTATALQVRDPNPLGPVDAINRYWDLNLTSGALTADLTFQYLALDLPAANNEAGYTGVKDNGTIFKFPVNCGGSPPAGTACVTPATHILTVKGVSSFSKWFAGALLGPTAANVTVSGRVLDSSGRGVSKAMVTMTDSGGHVVDRITNPFGYYRFDNVVSGASYVVSVRDKQYRFASRIISVNDDLADVDFVADP